MLVLRGTAADRRERLTWRVRAGREVSLGRGALIDCVQADQRAGKAGIEQAADVSGRQMSVMLARFDKPGAAARARRPLDTQLQSGGDVVLDSVVLKVNAKHKVTVYDPRRVRAGVLTAALTWGSFGLLTGGGTQGLIISAGLGAIIDRCPPGSGQLDATGLGRRAQPAQKPSGRLAVPGSQRLVLCFNPREEGGTILAT